jgi:hyperosmotically inducible protein
MRKLLLGALAIGITTSAGVALADNHDAERSIESRFQKDARLKGDDIKVDVDDGVATLKGKVATQAEKEHAARLAHVAGVSRVENKIEIDTSAAKDRAEDNAKAAKKRIDERADKAKDRVDAQEERNKERIDEHAKSPAHPTANTGRNDSAGDEVSDTWITTKVKSQFIGVDALKGSDISVDTDHNGVVTLSGTVPNETARARAIEIARATKGSRRVVDNMRLDVRK